MKRWAVPVVPFLLSLGLSAATVGTHAYWQDSGLYLTAVKELGVLYPPGFVMYETLCRIWTTLFGFLDFVLAVHLFSSVCAALAAATMAIAVRDLLRSRGPIFGVSESDPGDLSGACGLLAGALLATGFTFCSNAIYAKGYSLYYLILTLLIWRMIRADASGRPRDFSIVAALIGLSWQAHPSATLTGGALVLFVAAHAKTLGAKGVALRMGIAAACALGPSVILLPWLLSRDPWLVMGMPSGPVETLKYLAARRFVAIPGVFGLDSVRVASFGLFLWQEFLGVGLGLLGWGLKVLFGRNRRLLWGLVAWVLPYATVTILFKIEGQHDCWFVAAWLPLYLAVGVGAWRAAQRFPAHANPLLLGAATAAIVWAALANGTDLSQRHYTLAENFGRALLDPVDRDAVLLLSSDDSNALVSYLQRVRGDRPDVAIVTANFLDVDAGGLWYEQRLLREFPFLQAPDYEGLRRQFPQAERRDIALAAFLNANSNGHRSVFSERLVPLELIRPGHTLVPAGVSWKLVRQGPEATIDSRYWSFPLEPEQIQVGSRRARGQKITQAVGTLEVEPQRYEERLRSQLVLARFHLAMALTERGQYSQASRLCESIMALDAEYWSNPDMVHVLAISLHAAGEAAKAEKALRRSLEISVLPRNRATASYYLGELARTRGQEAEAERWFQSALTIPGLDEGTRRQIESRLKSK